MAFQVVNLDDCICAILQHIYFSFGDLSSNNNYYVVNVMSALYLITSDNKKHFKWEQGPQIKNSHY